MTILLVLTNLPDRASAEALASELVRTRLAACVNILPPCHSVYRWQGVLETAIGIAELKPARERDRKGGARDDAELSKL